MDHETTSALYWLIVSPIAWWTCGIAIVLLVIAVFVKALRKDDKRGLVRCPACAEWIQPMAKVCKHCGREVSRAPVRR